MIFKLLENFGRLFIEIQRIIEIYRQLLKNTLGWGDRKMGERIWDQASNTKVKAKNSHECP